MSKNTYQLAMLTPDNAIINFIDLIQKKDNHYKLATTIPKFFVDVNFGMLDNGNYELSFELQQEDLSKGINVDYFFTRPFILFRPGQKIFIQNIDIIQAKQSLSETSPRKFGIQFKAYEGNTDESLWLQSKQSAYIKFNCKIFEPHKLGVTFDLTTKDSETNGFYNAIRLNIDNIDMVFYYENIDHENGYYVFRHNGMIDYPKFRNIIDSTMIAFGVLSGFYMADSIYIIAQKSNDINGLTYRYENLKNVINSNAPIIPSGYYKDIPEDKLKLTSKQFNEFVRLLYTNEDYKRSAILLINASAETGCAKATLGAVALETITSVIGKNVTIKKVIDNKQIISSLKYKLTKALKEFKETISQEQFNILKNKIGVINSMPNSNKYIEAFKISGIDLNEEDIYCIKCRNLFLHGNLPKREKDIALSDDELLDFVSNRLVMLSSMLLLKKSGYNGFVIDKGMTQIIKWRMIRQGKRVKSGNCLREIVESSNPISKS